MKSFMKFLVGAILGVIALIGIKEAPVQAAAVSWEAPEWTDYHTAEFRWRIPSDVSNYDRIQITIFKDGSEYWGSGNVPLMYIPGDSYYEETHVSGGYLYGRYPLAFDASGSYTLQAVAYDIDEYGSAAECGVSSFVSTAYEYTLPSTALPAPSNPRWVDHTGDDGYSTGGVFAYATWDSVPGACVYVTRLITNGVPGYTLYYNWSHKYGWGFDVGETNYSYSIGDTSQNEYTFEVLAIPADITAYAPSSYSAESAAYTVSGAVVEGQIALNTIIESGVSEANVDAVVEDIKDIDQLDTVLRTSNQAINNIAYIEDIYKLANQITETPPTSSVEGIDASDIEITGAALNVSAGTTLGFNIGTPTSYPTIDADKYKGALVFDMGIQASDGTDFSQVLDIPVTITLPIPDGFNFENLKLLHFRADGSYEEVPARIEAGYITISIYHFSTFAFVESTDAEVAPASLPPIIPPYNAKLLVTDDKGVTDNIAVTLAYTHQGEAATARANAVAGKDAFCIASYNIHVYDKANYNHKTGRLVFGLRSDMVVKNRSYFAVMIDKGGNAILLNDVDLANDTLTFDIDIDGYAIFIYFVDGNAPTSNVQADTPAPSARTYVVQEGDTLSLIAAKLGTTPAALGQLNNIRNLNLIHVGQILIY